MTQAQRMSVGTWSDRLLLWLLTGLMAWVALNTWMNGDRITRLEQIVIFGTADRYHLQDAVRDFALRDVRIDELEKRVERLEQ